MDLTVFLAQLWGPVLLAVGIGLYASRSYYTKIYRDLEKEPLAVLMFAMIGMAAGILQVEAHNSWETFPEGLVSLLGWGLLVKGTLFAIAPGLVDKMGDWAISAKLPAIAGVLALLVGAYLTWLGYLV